LFQLAGAISAVLLARFWNPDIPAADLVVSHDPEPAHEPETDDR
jgi:hypothetical protein